MQKDKKNLANLLIKADKLSKSKEIALAEEFINITDTIDELSEKLDTFSEELKKKDYLLEFDKEELKGDKGEDGIDGEDYILTESDKEEIASKIEVPVVEKVVEKIIEKTEVIRETPIVTNEIKEVAKYESAESLRDKLETLTDDSRLDASAIKNLPEFIESDKRIGFGSMLKEAPKDGLVYGRQNREWVQVSSGGATWGSITGNIVDQADLQNALNAKQDTITTGTTAQYFRGDLSLATFPTLVSSFTNDAGYITSSALSGYVPNTRTLTINGTAYDLSADRSWTIATPTASTGLTNTSGTWTANLSTGVSGGQSVIGGTASGNNLTLSSTTNATKGKILFGNSAYDEVNNRLGIGTNAPSAKLEVRGTGDFWGLQVGNGTVGTLFQVYGGNAGFVGFNGSGYNSLDIRSGISSQLFIATNGGVGIGTTTPNWKLHVAGTVGADNIIAQFGDANKGVNIKTLANGTGLITSWNYVPTDPSAIAISAGANFGFNASPSNFYGMGLGALRNGKYDMWFQTGTLNGGGYRWYTGGTNERMTINKDGKVGIGTTTPTALLMLAAGTATAGTAPLKLTTGTNLTTAEVGAIEYNNTFHVTNSDATRRHVATAPNTTKVTTAAPYTNDGYITINIGGTDFKVMTTA